MHCAHVHSGVRCPLDWDTATERFGRQGMCPFHAVPQLGRQPTEPEMAVLRGVLQRACEIETDDPLVINHLPFPNGFRFPPTLRRPLNFLQAADLREPEILSEIRQARSIAFQVQSLNVTLNALICSGPISAHSRSTAILKLQDCTVDGLVTLQTEYQGAELQVIGGTFGNNLHVGSTSAKLDLSSTLVRGQVSVPGNCTLLQITGTADRRSSIGKLVAVNISSSGTAKITFTDFTDVVNLSGATILERLEVEKTRFSGGLNIAGAVLKSGLRFNDVEIVGVFNARSGNDSKTIGALDFGKTRFLGPVDFNGREFTDYAHFQLCEFHKAPAFFACTFHQGIVFPRADAFKDTASAGAVNAYRTLKQEMEKLRARREEGIFYALEQRSLVATPGALRRNERIASTIYGGITDYGQNFLRPLMWLLLVTVGFTGIYGLMLSKPCDPCEFNPDALISAIKMGVEFSVNPFRVWRKPIADLGGHATAIQLTSTLHSLIALTLIALFLLALRWRFKRD